MEYYSATKKYKLSTHTIPQTDLKALCLMEKYYSQKVTYCMLSFTENSQHDKTVEIESRSVIAKACKYKGAAQGSYPVVMGQFYISIIRVVTLNKIE